MDRLKAFKYGIFFGAGLIILYNYFPGFDGVGIHVPGTRPEFNPSALLLGWIFLSLFVARQMRENHFTLMVEMIVALEAGLMTPLYLRRVVYGKDVDDIVLVLLWIAEQAYTYWLVPVVMVMAVNEAVIWSKYLVAFFLRMWKNWRKS